MKYIPILFSTPMVQAILEDRKTMTRRIVKPQPDGVATEHRPYRRKSVEIFNKDFTSTMIEDTYVDEIKCPYGKVGDVLWVRETTAYTKGKHEPLDTLSYKADHLHVDILQEGTTYDDTLCTWNDPEFSRIVKWQPSIHMPKSACRIFLQIDSIRVERLHDINEDDAKAEGVKLSESGNRWLNYIDEKHGITQFIYNLRTAKDSFLNLWKMINGRDSLRANPWVWVISFKKVPKPEGFI